MIVHVYCICWNEEKMLPFFFRHYDDIADQYFVFDNGSTDQSLAMLKSHPKVTLEHFDIQDNSLIRSAQHLFNHFWKASRNKADWIIVCDIDEHLYHPNLKQYLQQCTSQGITLVVPQGYQMISDSFPGEGKTLCRSVRTGVRSTLFDKPQIFNPNAIQEMNFGPGRHQAAPAGEIIRPHSSEVLLLHYKYLGLEYLSSRYSTLKQGLREDDTANRWGFHYLWDEAEKRRQFEVLKNQSVIVL